MIEISKNSLKYHGIYRSLVMDNADPLEQGRIRTKVYPMFDEIDTEYLPWAVPAMSLFDGAGNGFGSLSIPKEGSFVFVFFEAGDIYQPVYFAEAQTKTYGIPSGASTNYPNRKVWKTKNGIEITVDDTKGSELVLVEHPSGSYIKLKPSGDVIVSSPGEVEITGTTVSINP